MGAINLRISARLGDIYTQTTDWHMTNKELDEWAIMTNAQKDQWVKDLVNRTMIKISWQEIKPSD